jgi:hypothetical protein
MIQCARGLRLLFKATQTFRVGRERSRQNLDRNITTDFCVARAIDFAHPAFTYFREDAVLTDGRVGGYAFAHCLSR